MKRAVARLPACSIDILMWVRDLQAKSNRHISDRVKAELFQLSSEGARGRLPKCVDVTSDDQTNRSLPKHFTLESCHLILCLRLITTSHPKHSSLSSD